MGELADREITLDALRTSVSTFATWFAFGAQDRGLGADGEGDLLVVAHRRALHEWLNAWGCRIRYARTGEPDLFDVGVAAWWSRHGAAIATITGALSELGDDQITHLGMAFADLSASPIARTASGIDRTMGATAAAKALYALRPRAVMPWDLEIARRLHGGRGADAFEAHLRLGRDWARRLLDETGWDEPRLAVELGQPGATLARLLDQHCYVRFTLDSRPARP